jgi:hypothetical protein
MHQLSYPGGLTLYVNHCKSRQFVWRGGCNDLEMPLECSASAGVLMPRIFLATLLANLGGLSDGRMEIWQFLTRLQLKR